MQAIYSFEMEDFYGDVCEIFVYEDDTAAARYFDYDSGLTAVKSFHSETAAYIWAYKRGYRE